MHIVVFKNVSGSESHGVITWSCFESKDQFNSWWLNSKNAKNWYKIIEEGVSEERAIELCSTPIAQLAANISQIREFLVITNPKAEK